jgi:sec-independent protein translocase protein TatA
MGLDNPLHIALLVVLLLVVFGAKRLPEMGRSIGTGMREFKDSISGDSTPSLTQATQQPLAPAQSTAVQAPAPVHAPAAPPAAADAPVAGPPAGPAH